VGLTPEQDARGLALWRTMQNELSSLSTVTRHEEDAEADHYVQESQPARAASLPHNPIYILLRQLFELPNAHSCADAVRTFSAYEHTRHEPKKWDYNCRIEFSMAVSGMSRCIRATSGRDVSDAARLVEAKRIRQLLYWCAYMVVVPVGFIAVLWVIALLVENPHGSFGEVFGTGELLPLGALLLLSVSADIRVEDDTTRASAWMAVHEVLFVTLAIGAITVYGPLRTRALELLKTEPEGGSQSLRVFANLSWVYIGYAALHAVPVKALLLRSSTVRS
jgi:hypothetical protein